MPRMYNMLVGILETFAQRKHCSRYMLDIDLVR